MSKFKVGDTVKVICNDVSHDYSVDSYYTITSIESHPFYNYLYKLDYGYTLIPESNFIKIYPKRKWECGDKFIARDGSSDDGKIFTIARWNHDTLDYLLDNGHTWWDDNDMELVEPYSLGLTGASGTTLTTKDYVDTLGALSTAGTSSYKFKEVHTPPPFINQIQEDLKKLKNK